MWDVNASPLLTSEFWRQWVSLLNFETVIYKEEDRFKWHSGDICIYLYEQLNVFFFKLIKQHFKYAGKNLIWLKTKPLK